MTITTHSLRLTPHSSLLTPHFSLLTSYASLLTPHSSLLTPHFSLLTVTLIPGSAVSLPRTASVIPSAKYASAESPRFSNGSTATRRSPEDSGLAWLLRQANNAPAPIRRPRTSASAVTGIRRRCTVAVVVAAVTTVGAAGAAVIGEAVTDAGW